MNSLKKKTILVTGASGFIGSHLSRRLSGIDEVRLILLSRKRRQSSQENTTWLNADMEQLSPEFWGSHGIEQIDYVFHLGGFTPKRKTDADLRQPVIGSNILGTRMLVESLPVGTQKLIFSSSLDVYGLQESKEPLTETSRTVSETLYGASKLFCESLISTWAKERDCEYAILRYGHIYGPGEGEYGKLIPMVIRNLLEGRPPVIWGDGSALRDYLYVGDAVDATIKAAEVEGNVGPLNIVRGESITIRQLVQLLVQLTGSNKEIDYLTDRPNGYSFRFDNRLSNQKLGDWTVTSLEEGLTAEIEAFRRKKHE